MSVTLSWSRILQDPDLILLHINSTCLFTAATTSKDIDQTPLTWQASAAAVATLALQKVGLKVLIHPAGQVKYSFT